MMDTPTRFDWTPERVEHVRKRWAEGAPASQIAFELGDGATRSMVLGKIHRLKLERLGRKKALAKKNEPPLLLAADMDANQFATPTPTRRTAHKARSVARVKVVSAPLPPSEPYVEQQDEGVDVTALIGLLALTDQTCKFPIGDPLLPGFGFCGKPPAPEKVYCPHHCAKAYNRPGVSK